MTDTPQPHGPAHDTQISAPQLPWSPSSTIRPLLIVSPVSGGGRGQRALAGVRAAFIRNGVEPIVHHSASLADAADRVRRADRRALIVALGGDGLLGAVAGAASETGAVLLPLAGGRGNDTVRRLGLGLDPVATVQHLHDLTEHRIDLGWVRTQDDSAAVGRAFLGVSATGFDGVANELGNGIRLRLGPLTYLAGGALALFRFHGAQYTITVDGRVTRTRGWFVTVANHGQYGGGVQISPDSRVTDGTLEAVQLRGGSVLRAALVLLAAYRGAHLGMRGVTVEAGREVRIDADQPLGVFADGERVGSVPATVTVRRGALRVLAGPRAAALGLR